MKFKFSTKMLVIITAFLSLFITIFIIQNTYARYSTSLLTTSYVEFGKWLLLVNDSNIISNSNISDSIVLNTDTNSYISQDKIAPTVTGYIDITINYADVTVPFEYELTFSQDETNKLDDFKLTNYLIDSNNYTYENTSISNTIIPDGTTTTQSIQLQFEWVDDAEETLNDIQDTNISNSLNNIIYNLNISFTQLQPTDVTT